MPRSVMGLTSHYARLLEMLDAHGSSNDCLVWPYSRDKNGYGVVQFEQKANRAHKVAFRVTFGHWAKPYTLHHCDNPPCFNPLHLYAGTMKDNASDRVKRGRQARGEDQGLAVLTEAQVLEIKRDYRYRKVGCYQLAEKYGVCPATIHHALIGRTWRHLL